MLYSNDSLGDQKINSLLQAWRNGNEQASDQIFSLIYAELNKIAARLLAKEGAISLATGDLVNEAALRLINLNKIEWQDKAHFLALSSTVMRQVLVDHSRKKMANKRHHEKVTLFTNCEPSSHNAFDIIELENALKALQEIDPQRVKIVEMRYYGGLSLEQIALVMGVSASTIKRSWRASRAWLLNALETNRTAL